MMELKMFNNDELGFNVGMKIDENGDVLGRVEDVAIGLNICETKGDKKYVKLNRVNKYLQGFGVSTQVAKDDFIPESMIYLLAMKANNETAIKFQMWLATDVIPEVRRNGMYISETATIEQKEYNFNMLDVTFGNCSIELIKEKYEECMTFHKNNNTRIPYAKNSKKRSDARHSHSDSKIKIMNKIVQILECRNGSLIDNGRFGLISEVNDVIKVIKDDINKQYNKSSGAKIGGKTKKIKELEFQIEKLTPPSLDKFVRINYHVISNNKLYNGNENNKVKSDYYKTWMNKFPHEQVPSEEYWEDVDFTKPIRFYIRFSVVSERFDTQNMEKGFIDQVMTREMGIDDNIIKSLSCESIGLCDSFDSAETYFYIENIN